ncbi:hypothetical protein T484DRAFT_3634000 [Baffinella frigidus]|nr:hypothetical protein T484DRAFT_3634000 [Cryptophyta sp. CCMP2293]
MALVFSNNAADTIFADDEFYETITLSLQQLNVTMLKKFSVCLVSTSNFVFFPARAHVMYHAKTPEDVFEFMDNCMTTPTALCIPDQVRLLEFVRSEQAKRSAQPKKPRKPRASKPKAAGGKASADLDYEVVVIEDDAGPPPFTGDMDWFLTYNAVLDEEQAAAVQELQKCHDVCKKDSDKSEIRKDMQHIQDVADVDLFGRWYDSVRSAGTKTRQAPVYRDAGMGHCNCDEHGHQKVVFSGCADCCVDYDASVHVCECQRDGQWECGECFPEKGCMHKWDTSAFAFCLIEYDLCLVCSHFQECDDDGQCARCPHNVLMYTAENACDKDVNCSASNIKLMVQEYLEQDASYCGGVAGDREGGSEWG